LLGQEPLLAVLWIYLLGFFAIGLVESNLLGVEIRMLFLIFSACFSGLLREQRVRLLSGEKLHRYAPPAIADPRPI
jgi:hypothetical protein